VEFGRFAKSAPIVNYLNINALHVSARFEPRQNKPLHFFRNRKKK